ncbi:MAG: hypothetical protein ACYCO9_10580 [Streptosporangiaceae bacterium]
MAKSGHATAAPPRRVVLAAAAAGSILLAGCKGLAALGPAPKTGADVATLKDAIAAEETLIAQYNAALAAFSALSGQQRISRLLAPILAEHRAHLDRLRARLIQPAGPSASPKPGPSATPTPTTPGGRRQILADLAAAERTAAGRLTGQLAAMPPATARLMASISASEAAHVVALSHAGLA